jgi:Flp pilus assembly protein TadG
VTGRNACEGWLRDRLRLAWRDANGAVSPLMALLLIPIIGVLALAGEVGYWAMAQRTMQHAADSAAIAAAANNDATQDSGVERYKREASAVAKNYPIGSSAVTTVKMDCPGSAAGALDCYRVTINRNATVHLARVIGFNGSGGNGTTGLTAVAYAKNRVLSKFFCISALGTSSAAQSFGINLSGGGTNINTCYGQSAGKVKCAGNGNDFITVFAPSQQGGTCANYEYQDPSIVTDPYEGREFTFPSPACSSATSYSTLSWTLSGDTNYARVCSSSPSGLKTLASDQTATCPTDRCAILIDNTTLNLNDHTLTLNKMTVVFTNSSGSTLPTWFDDNKGTINVTAPTDGTLGDFAIIDDPDDTSPAIYDAKFANVNFAGILYAKNRELNFNGSVDTSVVGQYCTTIVAKSVVSNGGKLGTADCDALGYTPPSTPAVREALVQ